MGLTLDNCGTIIDRDQIFLSLESSAGNGDCNSDYDTTGSNDIWGCASSVSSFTSSCWPDTCGVFSYSCGNVNTTNILTFDDDVNELNTITFYNDQFGGVLCCRDDDDSDTSDSDTQQDMFELLMLYILPTVGIVLVIGLCTIYYCHQKAKKQRNSTSTLRPTAITPPGMYSDNTTNIAHNAATTTGARDHGNHGNGKTMVAGSHVHSNDHSSKKLQKSARVQAKRSQQKKDIDYDYDYDMDIYSNDNENDDKDEHARDDADHDDHCVDIDDNYNEPHAQYESRARVSQQDAHVQMQPVSQVHNTYRGNHTGVRHSNNNQHIFHAHALQTATVENQVLQTQDATIAAAQELASHKHWATMTPAESMQALNDGFQQLQQSFQLGYNNGGATFDSSAMGNGGDGGASAFQNQSAYAFDPAAATEAANQFTQAWGMGSGNFTSF